MQLACAGRGCVVSGQAHNIIGPFTVPSCLVMRLRLRRLGCIGADCLLKLFSMRSQASVRASPAPSDSVAENHNTATSPSPEDRASESPSVSLGSRRSASVFEQDTEAVPSHQNDPGGDNGTTQLVFCSQFAYRLLALDFTCTLAT